MCGWRGGSTRILFVNDELVDQKYSTSGKRENRYRFVLPVLYRYVPSVPNTAILPVRQTTFRLLFIQEDAHVVR
jgi:hypothetical protein